MKHLSNSLEQVNRFKFLNKGPSECLISRLELFSEEELLILKEKISISKLNEYEKRFDEVYSQKQVQNKKSIDEMKANNKKLYQNKERLEYILLNLKEKDQKNKIYQFQINEYKSESRVLLRKNNEITKTIARLNNIYEEKIKENTLLRNQIEDLKKQHLEFLERAKIEKEKEEVNNEDEEMEDDGNQDEENEDD